MKKVIFLFLCGALFLSCAKPTDPESLYFSGGYTIVGRLQLGGYGEDVKVRDTIAYVAQNEGNLAIVSIADRTRPRFLSFCHDNLRGAAVKVCINDTVVYVVEGSSGCDAVNVANPYAPVQTQHFGGGNTTSHAVAVFCNWLVHARGSVGWELLDLSYSPANPANVGPPIESPGFANGLAVTADSLVLVASGELGLAVYSVKDIGRTQGYYDAHTPPIAAIDLPGYSVDVDTLGSQRVAFVACGTAGVQIVDYSDTSNVRVIGSYPTGGYAKEIKYMNGRVYVTTELRGLQVLSVQDLTAPQLVASIHTTYAIGLAVDQHYVYVADETEGLIIVAIPPY